MWLIVLVSAAVFTLRGPLRASANYADDFAAPYISARLWLRHQDPYNNAAFWVAWRDAGAPLTAPGGGPVYANPSSSHSVYPPPSVVAASPLALLPWFPAWAILIVLSTALYLGALLLLTRLLPGTWSNPCKPAFLAFGLLFAPSLSSFHVSNLTSISAGLLLIASYLLLKPYAPAAKDGIGDGQTTDLLIALLLAVSLCLKPTLAPFILIYLLCERRWKLFGITVATSTIITAIFFALEPNLNWLASLRSNIDFLFNATYGAANLGTVNPGRSDRIDLQLPIYTLTHSRNVTSALAILVTLILLALCLGSILRHGKTDSAQAEQDPLDRRLLLLSTLLAIGLLPFYQRFYSAMVLLPPVLWCLRNLAQTRARWVLGGCAVFLANTSIVTRRLGVHFPVPPGREFFDIVIMPHLCWIILVISLLLLSSLRFNSKVLSSSTNQ